MFSQGGLHEGADHFVRLASEAGDTNAHCDLAHMRENPEALSLARRSSGSRLAHLAARENPGIYGVLALILGKRMDR
ncbi:hypothetical protein HUT05_29150 [Streptomyces chartreusis]|uniref:Uncharacterized protein n=1 Tax=Streptomyces chartreusis TaxID=1969 RepID=A0A7H8TCB0_STRCX|nr:hypothetical protein HUT05_29150 [Streptomyces chartreusis]